MCQVVKHEGWDRLYGGLMPSLVGTAASQGVYYYFYPTFRNKAEAAALERRKLEIGDGSVGMLSSLLVAALSGYISVSSYPTSTHTKVSTKSKPSMQSISTDHAILAAAAEPPPCGTIHVIQEVYDEAGVWGFWRGVLPTLIMVSNPSIQFMLYETMLKKLKERRTSSNRGKNWLTALEIFLLGALAKLGATVVTYPLLVVKVLWMLSLRWFTMKGFVGFTKG